MVGHFGEYYYLELADTIMYILKIYLYLLLMNNVVIKKKVNENARKATNTMCMMDYSKSNDCILYIHHLQNERHWSINNYWSCILGYLGGDRLQIVVPKVLAASIGKTPSETLTAPS
jgi:hypothetical protein